MEQYHGTFDHLEKGTVSVEFSELGEGFFGEYNPRDCNDVELLRFYVQEFIDCEWYDVDDSSYCTQLPVETTDEQRKKALQIIMDEVYEPVTQGKSIKKICEKLSWISLDWLAAVNARTRRRVIHHALVLLQANLDDYDLEEILESDAEHEFTSQDYDQATQIISTLIDEFDPRTILHLKET